MIRNEKANRPDEELARLAADGDAAAFDEILEAVRISASLCRSVATALGSP